MTPSIIDRQSQEIRGFIHFNCFCGLDIYCFGSDETGNAPSKAINQFRRLLGDQPAGIFSSAVKMNASCPACGMDIELPSSEVIALFAERDSRRGAPGLQVDSAVLPGLSTSAPT